MIGGTPGSRSRWSCRRVALGYSTAVPGNTGGSAAADQATVLVAKAQAMAATNNGDPAGYLKLMVADLDPATARIGGFKTMAITYACASSTP